MNVNAKVLANLCITTVPYICGDPYLEVVCVISYLKAICVIHALSFLAIDKPVQMRKIRVATKKCIAIEFVTPSHHHSAEYLGSLHDHLVSL